MLKLFRQSLFCLLALLCTTCRNTEEEPMAGRAFYHWKTVFELSPEEKNYLEKLQVTRLYLHFFDVDLDPSGAGAMPKAEIIIRTIPTQEIIPTVFITNRTFSGKTSPDVLAENILKRIEALCSRHQLTFHEIQLDCDWSVSTRGKYFRLLRQMKEKLPGDKKLSVTIRLHQIRFPDITGIPPVESGSLMLYNTGDWKDVRTHNSLFDPAAIAGYFDKAGTYPVPLDIALPVFEQTLVYRNSTFLCFLKDTGTSHLIQDGLLKKTPNPAIFVCSKDTVLSGISFRPGDLFRHEQANTHDLLKIRKLAATKLTKKKDIILYHIHEKVLRNYPSEQLEKVFSGH